MAACVLVLTFTLQSLAQMAAPAPALSAAELELAGNITAASIKEMTAALSSAEMQGRGTMQPGGEKAAAWIADRFQKLGLKPLGDKGTYLQKIDFKETSPTAGTVFKVGDKTLAHGSDFALLPQNNGDKDVSGEMVFVGYAIQATQAGVDNLKGIDPRGKIIVLLEGPPEAFEQKAWDDQKAGQAVMMNLIMKGAAAIVYVGQGREKNPPDELISYFSRRQIAMPNEKGYPSMVPPFVYVSKEAAGKLFEKSGLTYAQAIEKAETLTEFQPIDLKQKGRLVAKYKTVKGTSPNVVGYIEGSDPKLREEAILFSAHYDAYGTENGKIYFGAADNALGTAEMLAVAEAYSKMPTKPKRSMVFLAVTAEEYGLYGSKYWAKNPTWNIKKVAANLNLDGIGTEVYGPVKTMVGFGAEHSSLGAQLADLTKSMGIELIPDPTPEEKVFYRSDHYSFVERGVPALMLLGAPAGEKEVWLKRIKEWEKTDYHNTGDVIRPEWSWEGAETVADVMGILGLRIAENPAMPAWLPSSRFAKLERGFSGEVPAEN
jgi:hypothetical protein